MTDYFRPLARTGEARPATALPLAGTQVWFTEVEHLRRGGAATVLPVSDLPAEVCQRLTAPRPSMAGLDFSAPVIMGILNVTPDSFSDGGAHDGFDRAVAGGVAMSQAGADILDIGGESTRPGADVVAPEDEIARIAPVIAALRNQLDLPISLDTRKATVAQAGLAAGASLINDVSGFTFDADLAPLCAELDAPICVMHTQGEPQTMQNDPQYDNVLLDVYDTLEAHITRLEASGIARDRIIVDPGLGFGKTQAHNLALMRGVALFHGLGCPILLGASRKGFIGRIGQAPDAASRAPGSIAVALAALAQGVQIVRVHDVAETRQAIALWQAVTTGDGS